MYYDHFNLAQHVVWWDKISTEDTGNIAISKLLFLIIPFSPDDATIASQKIQPQQHSLALTSPDTNRHTSSSSNLPFLSHDLFLDWQYLP